MFRGGSKGTNGCLSCTTELILKYNRRACGIHEGSKRCHPSSIRGGSKGTKGFLLVDSEVCS
ncbi:MAG TPA: hypothetical protein HA283_06740 [Nanoarchaeota archaeon]|nr:hypothetical protein [Nanoarchaeota archaeon]HIH63965.1 hypothetical protein [Nanoarchaeota archaeon]HIJ09693.1 hypothetical protein [Nanoarchaeota archaeon]